MMGTMDGQGDRIGGRHRGQPRWAAAWIVIGLVVAGAAGSPQAAEPSPQVRAALEVLANSSAGGAAPADGPMGAGAGGAPPTRIRHAAASPAPVGRAGSPAPSMAATAAPPHDATGAVRARVVVARGQSLDALVQAHYGASPLKPETVREAVVRLNPQAFPPDPKRRLPAGTELLLPTRDDLIRQAFGAPVAAPAHEAPAETTAGARRGWVRYP